MADKRFNIDNEIIPRLSEEYRIHQCIRIHNLISEKLLKEIVNKVNAVEFQPKIEDRGEIRQEFGKLLWVPTHDKLITIFNFIFNSPQLFEYVEAITDCLPIQNFTGRIHRSQEGMGHEIGWHGDNSDNRILALTINLGSEDYTGGRFQIRKKNDTQILCEYEQINQGDVLLFKISPELEHRLTVIETGIRTVGVGWFRRFD